MLKTKRFPEAQEHYKELVKRNPDNIVYHEGLMKSHGYTNENETELTVLYSNLAKEFPHSEAVRRLPLNFTHGPIFQSHLIDFSKKKLRKGVPSLFNDLKPLYKDPKKVSFIFRVKSQDISYRLLSSNLFTLLLFLL